VTWLDEEIDSQQCSSIFAGLFKDLHSIVSKYRAEKSLLSGAEELSELRERYLACYAPSLAELMFWRTDVIQAMIDVVNEIVKNENDDQHTDALIIAKECLVVLEAMKWLRECLESEQKEEFLDTWKYQVYVDETHRNLFENLFDKESIKELVAMQLTRLTERVAKREEQNNKKITRDPIQLKQLGLPWRCIANSLNLYRCLVQMLIKDSPNYRIYNFRNDRVVLGQNNSLENLDTPDAIIHGYDLRFDQYTATLFYKHLEEDETHICSNIIPNFISTGSLQTSFFSLGYSEYLYFCSSVESIPGTEAPPNTVLVSIDVRPLKIRQPPIYSVIFTFPEFLEPNVRSLAICPNIIAVYTVYPIDNDLILKLRQRLYDRSTQELISDEGLTIPKLPGDSEDIRLSDGNWDYISVTSTTVIGATNIIITINLESSITENNRTLIVHGKLNDKKVRLQSSYLFDENMYGPSSKWFTLRQVNYCLFTCRNLSGEKRTHWKIVALHRNRIIDVSSGELEIYCSFDYFDERTRSFMTLYQETKSSSGRTDLNDTLHKVVFKLCYN